MFSINSVILVMLLLCVGAVTLFKIESNPKALPTIRLSDGYEIPAVGLGTFRARENDCEQAVKDAIDAGYRHIDSAYSYGNEKEVGNGVRAKIDEGVIEREDMFITTKLWNTFHDPADVPRAFQKSFDNLNLTYIDLYLLHWPVAYGKINKDGSNTPPTDIEDVVIRPFFDNGTYAAAEIDYLDTWRAMEKLMENGKIRSIGISNFNSQQIDRLLSVATIKPVVNQVECHPNFNQHKLIKFCAARNITVTAYSPLGQPHNSDAVNLAINDPKIAEIAAAHNKLPSQVVLRYTYQNGAVVIPKSTHKDRIRSNIDIFDFELSQMEMEFIDGLNTNSRLVAFNHTIHDENYPFGIEF
ncbi:1,5-anhydro-D-fructose reductase-like isoform X2 [Bradysia coprophila]|uniref:1,5-anhydro-D-fructose reductase-like isoform X2 n=1 Tax=Bradysia coprophila TaxID=38358 RepID=UPI00187DD355|nr:1,5-anhydro-D-fructose reductase-like isoform X2 [Bradysia coprophila]